MPETTDEEGLFLGSPVFLQHLEGGETSPVIGGAPPTLRAPLVLSSWDAPGAGSSCEPGLSH